MRKLYKSTDNRIIAGVCAGIAEYFDIDPTVVRIVFVGIAIFTVFFPAAFFYIILALIIPN